MLVRHNAGFAAVPIMILSIARSFGRHPRLYRIAVPGAVGLLSCVLLQFCAVVMSEYLATYKTNIWASLAIFDMAGIIYRMPDRQQQQTSYALLPTRLQGPGSLDGLLETYNPITVDTLFWTPQQTLTLRTDGNAAKRAVPGKQPGIGCAMDKDPSAPPNNEFDTYCFELSDSEKHSLAQLWYALIISYPREWIFHKMAVFKKTIWTPRSYVYVEQSPKYIAEKMINNLNFGPNWLQSKLQRVPFHFLIIYRPLLYLALTLITIAFCLLRLTEERLQIALIAASGLANELGLFFVGLGGDYRYSHYMVYTSMLALLLLLRSNSSNRWQKVRPIRYIHPKLS
jgi:hypothetical protein